MSDDIANTPGMYPLGHGIWLHVHYVPSGLCRTYVINDTRVAWQYAGGDIVHLSDSVTISECAQLAACLLFAADANKGVSLPIQIGLTNKEVDDVGCR